MLTRRSASAGLVIICLSMIAVASGALEHRSTGRPTQVMTCTCPGVDELLTDLSAVHVLRRQAKVVQADQISSSLPSGRSTATSFWDGQTASGRAMSASTIASPYWPIGTRVKITYHGRSVIGTVWDFGPAEWAVAQHDPPAIVDLAEPMMETLTGTRENSVAVHFQVIRLGSGRVYRHSGTGHALATE